MAGLGTSMLACGYLRGQHSQGWACSSHKTSHELSLERRNTVRILSSVFGGLCTRGSGPPGYSSTWRGGIDRIGNFDPEEALEPVFRGSLNKALALGATVGEQLPSHGPLGYVKLFPFRGNHGLIWPGP